MPIATGSFSSSARGRRWPNRDGFIPEPRPAKFPLPEEPKHADTASGG
jgi:hypothetical protein